MALAHPERWGSKMVAAALSVAAISSFAKVDIRFVEEKRPELNAIRMWAEISSDADEDELKGVVFKCGFHRVGANGRWTIPAQFPPISHGRAEFKEGARFGCGWGDDPCAVIVEKSDGSWTMWLADLWNDYSDMAFNHVTEQGDGVEVSMSFQAVGYVRKGFPQKVGDVWTLRGEGGREAALAMIPRWYAAVGQHPPEGHDQDRLLANVIYSTDMRGPVEYAELNKKIWRLGRVFDGGFPAKRKVLPSLAALGVNAVWIRPVCGGYNPDDYYRIDEIVGTPDQFKDYVRAAHGLGLKVWHDAVAHGGSSTSKRFQNHPEWLVRKKDGTPAYTYWCADFNWPSWVEYMSKYVETYTRDYQLDGWRLDVPYGSREANWSRSIPYARASYAKLQGGLNQQRGMRAGARRANPAATTLGETLWNLHGNVSDAIHDIRLCHDVFARAPFEDVSKFVRNLRVWLDEQARVGMPGLVRMRYVESHDSLRAVRMYGQATRNLLFALTAFLPGMPMVYEEGEEGAFETYRRVLALRAANPALVRGGIRWIDEGVPDGVLAFDRVGEGETVTAAFNFNSEPCAFRSKTVGAVGWRLYGARLPESATPYVHRPAQGRLNVERSVEKDGRRIYRFRNGERWFAKTAEGVFESPWIVRHPDFDGSDGFVYRLALDATAVFDTLRHPFGFDAAKGEVGCLSKGSAAFLTGFDAAARVKVLDRVGDDHVLAVAVEGPAGERLTEMSAADVDLRSSTTGDGRVRNDFCGWVYESRGLKVRVNRHGVLMGVWRDGRKLSGRIELLTDEGKSGWSQREVRQGWDADTIPSFIRKADGSLVMRFTGQTRTKSRQYEARTSAPIDFVSTFAFSADGTFSYETEFNPDKRLVVGRGITFYIETEAPNGRTTREPQKKAGKFRRTF